MNKKILISGIALCLLFLVIGVVKLKEPELVESTVVSENKVGADNNVVNIMPKEVGNIYLEDQWIYSEDQWLADREKLAAEIKVGQAEKEKYAKVDENGNTTYYEDLIPSDYSLSWDTMLSLMNENDIEIFTQETKDKLPDNLYAYLGFVAWQYCEETRIKDTYSVDPETSIVNNINNDVVTYHLDGQLSELDITIDFYNEKVHLLNKILN